MALTIGINSGFVALAPSVDPDEGDAGMDTRAKVTKDTSPATAAKITEIGWYCDNATEEANFEVGLYAADGAVVPGEAGTLLYSDTINAKGTGVGWKTVSVDWAISPNTDYWLGIQLDNTTTLTNINYVSSGGAGYDNKTAQTTLTNPFDGGALADVDAMISIYAVWEAAVVGMAGAMTTNTGYWGW